MENIEVLIKSLIALPTETAWLEFKHNNYDTVMIGKNISALANSASYYDRDKAYMVWGIHDETHEILGTDITQYTKVNGNQELENWLRTQLSNNCEFDFYLVQIDGKDIVLLEISRANFQTVTFQKVDYIRVGSNTKQLMDTPSMHAKLWDRIRNTKFEEMYALIDLDITSALTKIDYTIYFDLKNIPLPTSQDGIVHYMLEEDILVKQDNGLFSITNLGAILFAKKLQDFKGLARKAVRVIQYEGTSRANILKEFVGSKGYVLGYEPLISFLEALLPSHEEITSITRKTITAYPNVALREIIANALIHQDFSITGMGITIEVFENRIEIINPGTPLIDVNRIIDNPPKSRNEKLASLMRNLKMCEELGSGWDRIVITCESEMLPAPKMELYTESTKVTMYSYRKFSDLSNEDKLWSCYLHACIKYVNDEKVTNASLRTRFGLDSTLSASISRLIKDALAKNLIKPLEKDTAPKHMKYIPWWA